MIKSRTTKKIATAPIPTNSDEFDWRDRRLRNDLAADVFRTLAGFSPSTTAATDFPTWPRRFGGIQPVDGSAAGLARGSIVVPTGGVVGMGPGVLDGAISTGFFVCGGEVAWRGGGGSVGDGGVAGGAETAAGGCIAVAPAWPAAGGEAISCAGDDTG